MFPRVFIFPAHRAGKEGLLIAVAEDGHVLQRAWFPSEAHWAALDPQYNRPMHAIYSAYYPDGYVVERVEAKHVAEHADLQRAMTIARSKPDTLYRNSVLSPPD